MSGPQEYEIRSMIFYRHLHLSENVLFLGDHMKTGLGVLLAIIAVLVFATTVYANDGITHNAAVVLKDPNGRQIGTATFTEGSNGVVHVNVDVSGLPPG